MTADIVDYMAHRINEADHVELRACEECKAVSLILFNENNTPYAAASFKAESWLPILKLLTDKCLELTR